MLGRLSADEQSSATNQGIKKVDLVRVQDFRQGSGVVRADGIVQSRGQAELKSQLSAPVATVPVSVGSPVYAGQIILTLQNADIEAQLEQAKASLDLAKGQYYTGGVSVDSAKRSMLDKIRDAYNKGSEIVNAQIDPILENNDGKGGRLSSIIVDSALSNQLISKRIDLIGILFEWKVLVGSLTSDSTIDQLSAAAGISQKNLTTIDDLLSDISEGLNESAKFATVYSADSISGWKVTVAGARSSVSLLTSALIGASSSLTSSFASYDTTATAQVALAEAGVRNLKAQLDKTMIRSPIDGKVAALPLGVGELATPGAIVATVVGQSGLEVKAYASGEDLNRIKIGAPVTIAGQTDGQVRSVAPSLGATNRKVEVVIAVYEQDSGDSGLKIGQNVQVLIQGEPQAESVSDATGQARSNSYLLPIQDVKIVPGEAYVYTVDEQSRIKVNPVILGEIKGDFIEVVSGITDDMSIVSPVYELDEGQVVEVEQ